MAEIDVGGKRVGNTVRDEVTIVLSRDVRLREVRHWLDAKRARYSELAMPGGVVVITMSARDMREAMGTW